MSNHDNGHNRPTRTITGAGSTVLKSSASDRRETCRTIEKVIDARGDEAVLRPAAEVLDGLTAVGLTELRRTVTVERQRANILFRCPKCNAPVYVATSPASSTGDGLGAFFKHYFKTPNGCDWLTDNALRSVGAVQFNGAPEGEEHRRLKTALADSIRCDRDFSKPVLERQIKIGDSWRKPDVFSRRSGKPIALEVQLARLSMITIIERTTAYREAGITLVWVTSADQIARLNSQAFRDLYLGRGGSILTIDAASCERSEEAGTLHLRELTLEPCFQPGLALYNIWRSRLVGPNVILMEEGQRHGIGQRTYGTMLAEKLQVAAPGLTHKIAEAIASGAELTDVAAEWTTLSKIIGARSLRHAIQDGLPIVLRWLQAVERANNASEAEKPAASKLVTAHAAHILASRVGKHWTQLIEHVADTVPTIAAAIPHELRVRIAKLKAGPDRMHAFHLDQRQMIAALHPWTAYWLLARAPAGTPPNKPLA